jgi:hypothetical protein
LKGSRSLNHNYHPGQQCGCSLEWEKEEEEEQGED